jgi:hypothetical protein
MEVPIFPSALRPGTVLEYLGAELTVTVDFGADTVGLDCAGSVFTVARKDLAASARIISTPRGELHYETFDAYVADFPEGERYRAWLAKDRECWLMRLVDPPHVGSMHGGLPGNFMALAFSRMVDGGVRLAAHDCDDGLMVRDFASSDEARAVANDMAQLTPFSMRLAGELFDFRWE